MTPKYSHCEFCDEFRGGGHNSFAGRYAPDFPDRTVLETDYLKVLPSLGHFVKGYLLLVPKQHYCAIADTPPEVIRDVDRVERLLARQLSSLYGPYIFFEHGARTPDSGGCGICHAHVHAVPLPANKAISKLKGAFPNKSIDSLLDLKDATSGASYLYFEDSSGRWVFFPTLLQSQYMRRLVAEAAGISSWDWRTSGREDALIATRDDVLGALSGGVNERRSRLS